MKISIVLPVFNPSLVYFEELLISVFNQTFINWELIVSDDSKESFDFIKLLSAYQDKRIKYFKNDSGQNGIFGNLNYAISKAEGELIQIFCQDDCMMPRFLEAQKEAFEILPGIGMVFSKYLRIDENSKILSDTNYKLLKNQLIKSGDHVNYFFAYGCLPGNLSPVMIKKEVLDKVGPFNIDYQYAGDFEYWIRIGNYFDLLQIREPNLMVRHHLNNASTQLGFLTYFRDIKRIQSALFLNNSIAISTWYKSLYVNQYILRRYLSFIYSSRSVRSNLWEIFDHKPYKILYAVIVFLITLNGKIPLKIEEEKLKQHS